jgi:GNAT superfamily N-acetyltransferase
MRQGMHVVGKGRVIKRMNPAAKPTGTAVGPADVIGWIAEELVDQGHLGGHGLFFLAGHGPVFKVDGDIEVTVSALLKGQGLGQFLLIARVMLADRQGASHRTRGG